MLLFYTVLKYTMQRTCVTLLFVWALHLNCLSISVDIALQVVSSHLEFKLASLTTAKSQLPAC